MFSKTKLSYMMIVFMLGAILWMMPSPIAHAEKCEDIKYEDNPLKMPGTHHDDNNPSESKAMKMIFGTATLCEVAYCYDNSECEGELTDSNLKKFWTTIVYEGSSEDQQDCLKYRAALPDHGEKALQLYEIYKCAINAY